LQLDRHIGDAISAHPNEGAMRTRPWRRLLVRLAACAALFGLDRGLAFVAVETNAAGALLSPAGASLEAFAVAAAFFGTRLTLSLAVCVTAALAASDVVRWAWGAAAARAEPEPRRQGKRYV
jgi:hypothetical protein